MSTADYDSREARQRLIGYGIAFSVVLGSAYFLYTRIPNNIELVVVPEMLFLIGLTLPFLLLAANSPHKRSRKISASVSCALWVASIVAGMKIPPSSNLIYYSDGLLLVGFIPLLHSFRPSWPWFIFGAFNLGIGIFLQAIAFMSDGLFPEKLVIAKHHLAQYHPAITWCTMGAAAIIWGLGRLTANQWSKLKKC